MFLNIMKKEIILLIGGLSFIIFVFLLNLLLADKFTVTECGCPKMVSQNFVGIFVFLSIVFVACLFYYLFSLRLEHKERIIKGNFEVLYSILDENEKKVIKKIVLNKGEIDQHELSEIYGKIKAHRLIKKLEQKNIITIKKIGKSNKIKLKEELSQELVK